jgi:hypothetical protein
MTQKTIKMKIKKIGDKYVPLLDEILKNDLIPPFLSLNKLTTNEIISLIESLKIDVICSNNSYQLISPTPLLLLLKSHFDFVQELKVSVDVHSFSSYEELLDFIKIRVLILPSVGNTLHPNPAEIGKRIDLFNKLADEQTFKNKESKTRIAKFAHVSNTLLSKN